MSTSIRINTNVAPKNITTTLKTVATTATIYSPASVVENISKVLDNSNNHKKKWKSSKLAKTLHES